jgi:hypothetical protein
MDPRDAVELAANIKTLQPREWLDVTDNIVYWSCWNCGDSSSIFIKQTGPNMCRIRLDSEDALTQAARENEDIALPLYREVVRLREENKQLQQQILELTTTKDSS